VLAEYVSKAQGKQKLSMALQVRNRGTVEKKLRFLFSGYSFVPLSELIDKTLEGRSATTSA
jgi:hypothetical protein